MKKIISIAAVLMALCMILCGCGKKTETPAEVPVETAFVPIDTTYVITGIRVSDGSVAFEDLVAYEIALAFNTITEYEAYDENAKPAWETVFISTPTQQSAEGTQPETHRISFLGDNTFNIACGNKKCKAVSEDLYKAFEKAILAMEAESESAAE